MEAPAETRAERGAEREAIPINPEEALQRLSQVVRRTRIAYAVTVFFRPVLLLLTGAFQR